MQQDYGASVFGNNALARSAGQLPNGKRKGVAAKESGAWQWRYDASNLTNLRLGYGLWNTGCELRVAGCELQVAGCDIRDGSYGKWDVSCDKWDASYDRRHGSYGKCHGSYGKRHGSYGNFGKNTRVIRM